MTIFPFFFSRGYVLWYTVDIEKNFILKKNVQPPAYYFCNNIQKKEEIQTGEKDLTEKILADYNDVFADIVNVLLFHGERRIDPDELQSTTVHSQYKAETGKLHEQERDVSKYWT